MSFNLALVGIFSLYKRRVYILIHGWRLDENNLNNSTWGEINACPYA